MRYDLHHTRTLFVNPDVESVTALDQTLTVTRERNQALVTLDTVEPCSDSAKRHLMLDAESDADRDFSRYLSFSARPVPDLAARQVRDSVVVSPDVRSSYVLGKHLQLLLKTLHLGLYYRPVCAFECHRVPMRLAPSCRAPTLPSSWAGLPPAKRSNKFYLRSSGLTNGGCTSREVRGP